MKDNDTNVFLKWLRSDAANSLIYVGTTTTTTTNATTTTATTTNATTNATTTSCI